LSWPAGLKASTRRLRACYSGPLDVKMAHAGAGNSLAPGTALPSPDRFGPRRETEVTLWGGRAGVAR
jgi:hypothetical protein